MDTAWVHQREFAGVDPSGDAQKACVGSRELAIPGTHHRVRSRSHRHNAEVYIPLKRKIRHGGQKGCMACCRHAGVYSQESRTRLQDTVDNEVAQSGKASSTDSPGQTALSLSSGPAQSSSSGAARAAGRPAPEIGRRHSRRRDQRFGRRRLKTSPIRNVKGCWQAGQIDTELTRTPTCAR